MPLIRTRAILRRPSVAWESHRDPLILARQFRGPKGLGSQGPTTRADHEQHALGKAGKPTLVP